MKTAPMPGILAVLLWLSGCGAASVADGSSAVARPQRADVLATPRLGRLLGVGSLPGDSPAELLEHARAVEALLDEHSAGLTLGVSQDELLQAAVAMLTWHAEQSARLAPTFAGTCRGCTARQAALYAALTAVARDHLLLEIAHPRLARLDGRPVTDAVQENVWQLTEAGVQEVHIGNTILAFERCRNATHDFPGLEPVLAYCEARRTQWIAVHERGRGGTDRARAAAEPDPMAPTGPAECWVPPGPAERPTDSVPAEAPTVVVTFDGTPTALDGAEQASIRARVREWARTRILPHSGGEIVEDAVEEAWQERVRRGQSVTEPTCAAPERGLGALADAAPVVLVLVITARCGASECSLQVRPWLVGASLPESLRVSFRASMPPGSGTDTARWLGLVDGLEQEALPPGYLAAAPPMRDELEVRTLDLVPASELTHDLRAAIGQHAPLRACVSDARRRYLTFGVRWGEDGRVADVTWAAWDDSTDAERACVVGALASLPPTQGVSAPQRGAVELAFRGSSEAREASPDPRSRYGRRVGAHRIHVRMFRSVDPRLDGVGAWLRGTDHAREAMARCLGDAGVDDTLFRRVSVDLDVDATGRVAGARAESELPALASCMEREMATLALPCPLARRPARVHVEVCGGRD